MTARQTRGRPSGAGTAPNGVVVWADGRLLPVDAPVLTAVDRGVTVGLGVFETCAVVRGHAFAQTRHLRRLERSAAGVGLALPNEQVIRDAIQAVLAAGGEAMGRVRVTVVARAGHSGLGDPDDPAPALLVVGAPASRVSLGSAVRVGWVRNERSPVVGLKTTSYAENVVALAAATSQGADEAILANTVGDLCEGTSSNVVVERDGALVTPSLASGCLPGVARELLLEWAPDFGIELREAGRGELPMSVLDDVLQGTAHLTLTSSIRECQPVAWLDRVACGPGPVSLRAQALFRSRVGDDLDP